MTENQIARIAQAVERELRPHLDRIEDRIKRLEVLIVFTEHPTPEAVEVTP